MEEIRIYLAAPFFSEGERMFNDLLCKALEQIGVVFYPYRDGLRMKELVGEHGRRVASELIIQEDCGAIERCDLVVAVLDGSDVDTGVCWELGYAYREGKPILGIHGDWRSFADFGLNPMISACLSHLTSSIDDAVMWVVQAESAREESKCE